MLILQMTLLILMFLLHTMVRIISRLEVVNHCQKHIKVVVKSLRLPLPLIFPIFFCVPSISSKLLSIQQCCLDNNCCFVFDATFLQDKLTCQTLFHGPNINGLYPHTSSSTPAHFMTHVGTKASYTVRHDHFGHPCPSILKNVLSSFSFPVSKSSFDICKHCLDGKMSKLPFSLSSSSTSCPISLVHSDVWGPAPEVSINGHQYYVSFVDDFSRYT